MINGDTLQRMVANGGGRDRIIDAMEDLRRRIIRLGVGVAAVAMAVFPFSEDILRWFQHQTDVPLAAFGIADAFLALVSIALATGLTAMLPLAVWEALSATVRFSPALSLRSRLLIWGMAMLLFVAGGWFCVSMTLPYGSQFLLSYGSEQFQPVISVRQFVSFCLVFVLGFGLLFELPLVMMVLARIRLVTARRIASYRRYAIVVITIVAAVVTPTPDIFNLMLLAVPLTILFEAGILGMRIVERATARQSETACGPGEKMGDTPRAA